MSESELQYHVNGCLDMTVPSNDSFRQSSLNQAQSSLSDKHDIEVTANLVIHMLSVDPKWVHPLPMDTPTVIPDTGGVVGPQTVHAGDSAFKSPFVGSSKIFRIFPPSSTGRRCLRRAGEKSRSGRIW
ncbi:hypothetical protein EDC04DRAFT_2775125 [Pisolithus marmoratus]|nr:hypothetical protein EDC04DRAFT_2775125 [Pisolithus marmoratus]